MDIAIRAHNSGQQPVQVNDHCNGCRLADTPFEIRFLRRVATRNLVAGSIRNWTSTGGTIRSVGQAHRGPQSVNSPPRLQPQPRAFRTRCRLAASVMHPQHPPSPPNRCSRTPTAGHPRLTGSAGSDCMDYGKSYAYFDRWWLPPRGRAILVSENCQPIGELWCVFVARLIQPLRVTQLLP